MSSQKRFMTKDKIMMLVLFLTLTMVATVALAYYDSRKDPFLNTSFWFESCKVNQQDEFGLGLKKIKSKNGQFVIYRICVDPIYHVNYNEIIVEHVAPLEEYIDTVVEYYDESQESWCYDCEYYCDECHLKGGPPDDWCISCAKECSFRENMKANGYVDATEFSNCKLIGDGPYYAGPMCAGEGGSQIAIGVFEDPECIIPDPTKQVDDILKDENGDGLKLWYGLLKDVFHNAENQFLEPEAHDPTNNRIHGGVPCGFDNCHDLFDKSGRCETRYGPLFSPVTEEEEREQEEVCTFIETLKNGGKEVLKEKMTNPPSDEASANFVAKSSLFLALIGMLSLGFAGVTLLYRKQVRVHEDMGTTYYELIPMQGMTKDLDEKQKPREQ